LLAGGTAYTLPRGLLRRVLFIILLTLNEWSGLLNGGDGGDGGADTPVGHGGSDADKSVCATGRKARTAREIPQKAALVLPADVEDQAGVRRAVADWVVGNLEFWMDHPRTSLATIARIMTECGLLVPLRHGDTRGAAPHSVAAQSRNTRHIATDKWVGAGPAPARRSAPPASSNCPH
jgi:hypothetical protein